MVSIDKNIQKVNKKNRTDQEDRWSKQDRWNKQNKGEKNKQKYQYVSGNQGMMTVEASVIVPIILIITIVQVFFSLFLIDMSVAKSEALRLAGETAAVWKTDGKLLDGTYSDRQLISRNKNFLLQGERSRLTGRAKTRLEKRVSARLNTASLEECKVSIRGDRVSTQLVLRSRLLTWGSKQYTGVAGWRFRCSGTADTGNEEEVLRQIMAKEI